MDEADRVAGLKTLSDRLGISFADIGLLDRALTHASTMPGVKGAKRDYESLEFLGDAVLGLAMAHLLFERLPHRTPGEYSRIRAALVNKRALARAAQAAGIGPLIRLGKSEELAGGRERQALLADCFEALVGAVYLDQGWNAALGLVTRLFSADVERECASEQIWDFKSRLQMYLQAEHSPLPEFVVVRTGGPDHRKEFEVEVRVRGEAAGRGVGGSKKEAEQNAARAALEKENVLVSGDVKAPRASRTRKSPTE